MRTGSEKTNLFNRIISGALAAVMTLALFLPNLRGTMADSDHAAAGAAILYFEGPAFEKQVEIGTARENLGLPAELSAVFETAAGGTVGDEADEGLFATGTSLAATPTHITAEDKNEIGGAGGGYYALNENGNVTVNVPVTWEGKYDGNTPGTYILKARVEGLNYSGEMPAAIITVNPAVTAAAEPAAKPGSISGTMKLDLSGGGRPYPGDEQPLAGVVVFLYRADDLSEPLNMTTTGPDGAYIFENLAPGNYILGIESRIGPGRNFLLPEVITDGNKFAAGPETGFQIAYTEVVPLDEGRENINAILQPFSEFGMRGLVTLANLKIANVNDEVYIDKEYWIVARKETVETGEGKTNYLYLIHKGEKSWGLAFGTSSTKTDYASSLLRTRMTTYYKSYPTIQALAVVPILGNHSSAEALTEPTAEMAGSRTEDIMFTPSYMDMFKWNGNRISPLITQLQTFYVRFYFRTARNEAEVYGLINYNTAHTIQGGINFSGTNVSDVPAVWVNANAVDRTVNIYYVDTAGSPIGTPDSETHTVTINEAFLMPSEPPDIPGYRYTEWRKGWPGSAQSDERPSLTKDEVIAGTDIYLVYEKAVIDVTISKSVEGIYADLTKAFEFNIGIRDDGGNPLPAGTKFYYEGDAATATDYISLNDSGEAAFKLKNGQAITIKDVPSNAKIKVVEIRDGNYWTTYTDSGTPHAIYEQDMAYDSAGVYDRTFSFRNIRLMVVPTGIRERAAEAVPLLIIPAALSGLAAIIAAVKRRLRAR